MCNAWNHPLGCTCGFGGEGHLGRPTIGNFGSYPSSHSIGTSHPGKSHSPWSIKKLGHPLTRKIPCWWCGEMVFFHTNGNDDCVLFDELGSWEIHLCWEIHRSEQRDAIAGLESSLRGIGYSGGSRNFTGRQANLNRQRRQRLDFRDTPDFFTANRRSFWDDPPHAYAVTFHSSTMEQARPSVYEANSTLSITGYVEDNHALYSAPAEFQLSFNDISQPSSWVRFEVVGSDGRLYSFLLLRSVAVKVEDNAIVQISGQWLKYRSNWFLVVKSLAVMEYPEKVHTEIFSVEYEKVEFLCIIYGE